MVGTGSRGQSSRLEQTSSEREDVRSAENAADNSLRRAEDGDVCRLGALWPLGRLELDLVALLQRLEAAAGDCAEMDEQILSTAVGRDEAEPLRVVEPLHSSGCHEHTSSLH